MKVQLAPDGSGGPVLLPDTTQPNEVQVQLPKIRYNPEVWRFHRIRIILNVIVQAGTIPVTFTESGKLMFENWAP